MCFIARMMTAENLALDFGLRLRDNPGANLTIDEFNIKRVLVFALEVKDDKRDPMGPRDLESDNRVQPGERRMSQLLCRGPA
jgi:hypothetical protein